VSVARARGLPPARPSPSLPAPPPRAPLFLRPRLLLPSPSYYYYYGGAYVVVEDNCCACGLLCFLPPPQKRRPGPACLDSALTPLPLLPTRRADLGPPSNGTNFCYVNWCLAAIGGFCALFAFFAAVCSRGGRSPGPLCALPFAAVLFLAAAITNSVVVPQANDQ
jgi:hypothetical protein